MPLVRIDDNGNDIEKSQREKKEAAEAIAKTRKELRQKKLIRLSKFTIACSYMTAAMAFFFYSENLGIMIATVPAVVLSFLNLKSQ